jgi:hypothetical protein
VELNRIVDVCCAVERRGSAIFQLADSAHLWNVRLLCSDGELAQARHTDHSRVVDPDWFNPDTDPDPAIYLNPDPDTDPDPQSPWIRIHNSTLEDKFFQRFKNEH